MNIRHGIWTFRPRFSIRGLLVAIAVSAVVCSAVVRVWREREYARQMTASNRLLEPLITHHFIMVTQAQSNRVGDPYTSDRIVDYHARMVTYYYGLLRNRCTELPPLPADLEAERRAIQSERRAAGYDPAYIFEEPPTYMLR